MNKLAQLDLQIRLHPVHADVRLLRREPVVIVKGSGANCATFAAGISGRQFFDLDKPSRPSKSKN